MHLEQFPQQVFTRTVKGVERKETRFLVPCPGCGCPRWLAAYNAQKNECCAACVPHSARARAGLAASRDHRLANPTKPEREIIRQLNLLDLPFAREIEIDNGEGGSFFIDFVIADEYAIEFNGYHHVYHEERDDRKRHAISRAGLPLLELTYSDLKDVENLRRTIGTFCRVLDPMEVSPRLV